MRGSEEAGMTETPAPYPARVDAIPDPSPSRWLWLVKWLLLVPHYVVLAFLWLAFSLLTVVAFFAILITGRYPRPLFDFDVGVLRWTWRVHHYGYGALGTDRYPPFTMADVPDYPAHLEVDYPARLSRGLVLVKWWLLALPQLLIVGVFVGGGAWFGTRPHSNGWDYGWGAGGLVGLLVLVIGVILLVTGSLPGPLYGFVVGLDRWVLRVAAYVSLMTDRYPPFRLDTGGTDPGSRPVLPPVPPPPGPGAPAPWTPTGGATGVQPVPARSAWTGGRVTSVVIGAVLLFAGSGLMAGGAAVLAADRTSRDVGGYLMSATATVSTDRYAVVSDRIELRGSGADAALDGLVGSTRLQVVPRDGSTLFAGVARTADADRWLSGVGALRLTGLGPAVGAQARPWVATTDRPGGPPPGTPASAGIWAAQATGPGTVTLDWRPRGGDWTVVVMRADGAAGVDVAARVGATLPALPWVATGLLVVGLLVFAGGAVAVAVPVHLAARSSAPPPGPGPWLPGPRPPADRDQSALPIQGRSAGG
jgi:Domain of unknown function (DUF4389)